VNSVIALQHERGRSLSLNVNVGGRLTVEEPLSSAIIFIYRQMVERNLHKLN